ncbi:MAG: C40 family peptidase [Saccharofermentans sp.]|nr:C40 family peptidase [Saccharofermentans sp.]
MMRNVYIYKAIALLAGVAISINYLSVVNVGASNNVALQAPEMEIMCAEPAMELNEMPLVIPTAVTSAINDSFVDDIDLYTYTIQIGDLESEDLLTIDEFTHDGNTYWVDVDSVSLRDYPSVDAEVVDYMDYADSVVRISYGSAWSYVRNSDGVTGYVLTSMLSVDEIIAPTPTPTPRPTSTPTPIPTATPTPVPLVTNFTETAYNTTVYASCVLNVRTGPGTEYALVTGYNYGDAISVTAQTDNGWYRTSSGYYVKCDLCLSEAPSAQTPVASTPTVDPSNYSGFASYCLQFVGTPYVYSGMSPSGFDCSGFVLYCYANYYGIGLPHNAAAIAVLGTPVSPENIQCGDIICHDYNSDGYIDHVSLYIGNGTCIHASNSRTGVVTTGWPMGSVVTIRRFT